MGWRHSCFSRGHYNSVSLCQSCQQTSCFQKLLGRLWSRGTVCWRTWTVNVECSNFRFGKRPFRHMYLDFKRVLIRVKVCVAVSSPVIRTDATRPRHWTVTMWQWYQVQSFYQLSSATSQAFIACITSYVILSCITSYRGQKDANSSLAIVSFSLYCLVLCYFLIGSNMHFTFCSFKTDKKKKRQSSFNKELATGRVW